MDINEVFQDINWKSLILGTTIFAFIVVLAIEYQQEILLMFSSAGLLYIGYSSKNQIQGTVLGAFGTLPLFLLTVLLDKLSSIRGEGLELWILISFLAIGAFCGFAGTYFAKTRKKAINQKRVFGKGRSKKKAKKSNK